jgi:hypothetical protein
VPGQCADLGAGEVIVDLHDTVEVTRVVATDRVNVHGTLGWSGTASSIAPDHWRAARCSRDVTVTGELDLDGGTMSGTSHASGTHGGSRGRAGHRPAMTGGEATPRWEDERWFWRVPVGSRSGTDLDGRTGSAGTRSSGTSASMCISRWRRVASLTLTGDASSPTRPCLERGPRSSSQTRQRWCARGRYEPHRRDAHQHRHGGRAGRHAGAQERGLSLGHVAPAPSSTWAT